MFVSSTPQPDDLFLRALKEGYRWQVWLGERWRGFDLEVVIPPLRVRPERSQAGRYQDAADLFVESWPIEVKSKAERFTRPENYPREVVYLGAWKRWESLKRKPLAFALISRPTESVVLVHKSSAPHWQHKMVENPVSGVTNDTIVCPRAWLRSETEFLNAMRRARGDRDEVRQG